MKLVVVTTLLVFCCLSPADAAEGLDCSWFDYQQDAQESFEGTMEHVALREEAQLTYDPDGNGIACEDLPERPNILRNAEMLRGSVEAESDKIIITGAGYSDHFEVSLAGLSFDDKDGSCQDFLSPNLAIEAIGIKESHRFYVTLGDKSRVPTEGDDLVRASVLAWLVVDDAARPVRIGDWLIEQGLAILDERNLPKDLAAKLEQSQYSARSQRLGMWGDCVTPSDTLMASFEEADAQDEAQGDEPTEPETSAERVSLDGQGVTVSEKFNLQPGRYRVNATVALQTNFDGFAVILHGPEGSEDLLFNELIEATGTWEGSAVATVDEGGEHFIEVTNTDSAWTVEFEPF